MRARIADALMPWVARNAHVWPSQNVIHAELWDAMSDANAKVQASAMLADAWRKSDDGTVRECGAALTSALSATRGHARA